MNPFEDRLQHAGRAIVGLHRIGEDKPAAGFQDSANFVQDPGSIAAVEDRILRPNDVERLRRLGDILETTMKHGNSIGKTGLARARSVQLVLGLAEVQDR